MSIPGLQLWLDASDGSTLFTDSAGTTPATADGDPVGRWADKSGNNRHATQADGTKKPTVVSNAKNLLSCLNFDAVNDWLSYSSASSVTFQHFFAVYYINQSNDYNNLWRTFTTNELCIRRYTNQTYWGHQNYADFALQATFKINGVATAIQNDGTWGVMSCYSASPISSSTTLGTYDVSRSLGDRIWNGKIAEIAVYSSQLTSNQINSVCNYLNSKWGVY